MWAGEGEGDVGGGRASNATSMACHTKGHGQRAFDLERSEEREEER